MIFGLDENYIHSKEKRVTDVGNRKRELSKAMNMRNVVSENEKTKRMEIYNRDKRVRLIKTTFQKEYDR